MKMKTLLSHILLFVVCSTISYSHDKELKFIGFRIGMSKEEVLQLINTTGDYTLLVEDRKVTNISTTSIDSLRFKYQCESEELCENGSLGSFDILEYRKWKINKPKIVFAKNKLVSFEGFIKISFQDLNDIYESIKNKYGLPITNNNGNSEWILNGSVLKIQNPSYIISLSKKYRSQSYVDNFDGCKVSLENMKEFEYCKSRKNLDYIAHYNNIIELKENKLLMFGLTLGLSKREVVSHFQKLYGEQGLRNRIAYANEYEELNNEINYFEDSIKLPMDTFTLNTHPYRETINCHFYNNTLRMINIQIEMNTISTAGNDFCIGQMDILKKKYPNKTKRIQKLLHSCVDGILPNKKVKYEPCFDSLTLIYEGSKVIIVSNRLSNGTFEMVSDKIEKQIQHDREMKYDDFIKTMFSKVTEGRFSNLEIGNNPKRLVSRDSEYYHGKNDVIDKNVFGDSTDLERYININYLANGYRIDSLVDLDIEVVSKKDTIVSISGVIYPSYNHPMFVHNMLDQLSPKIINTLNSMYGDHKVLLYQKTKHYVWEIGNLILDIFQEYGNHKQSIFFSIRKNTRQDFLLKSNINNSIVD